MTVGPTRSIQIISNVTKRVTFQQSGTQRVLKLFDAPLSILGYVGACPSHWCISVLISVVKQGGCTVPFKVGIPA